MSLAGGSIPLGSLAGIPIRLHGRKITLMINVAIVFGKERRGSTWEEDAPKRASIRSDLREEGTCVGAGHRRATLLTHNTPPCFLPRVITPLSASAAPAACRSHLSAGLRLCPAGAILLLLGGPGLGGAHVRPNPAGHRPGSRARAQPGGAAGGQRGARHPAVAPGRPRVCGAQHRPQGCAPCATSVVLPRPVLKGDRGDEEGLGGGVVPLSTHRAHSPPMRWCCHTALPAATLPVPPKQRKGLALANVCPSFCSRHCKSVPSSG
jgi:hypothetical protein